MFDVLGFLEPIMQGNWKYLGGLVIGTLTIALLRVCYLFWIERQTSKDIHFIQMHQNIPIKTLKNKAWIILLSVFVLVIVILPSSMWITVEILKSIENINPGIALLYVFGLFNIMLMILIIQTVRYRRLNRRISLIK